MDKISAENIRKAAISESAKYKPMRKFSDHIIDTISLNELRLPDTTSKREQAWEANPIKKFADNVHGSLVGSYVIRQLKKGYTEMPAKIFTTTTPDRYHSLDIDDAESHMSNGAKKALIDSLAKKGIEAVVSKSETGYHSDWVHVKEVNGEPINE